MKTIIIIGLFVMFLVSVQFASAKTVDEVIDKYMAARGGRQKLNALKSIYMEGLSEANGNETVIKIIKEQDKLSRTTIESATSISFNLITTNAAWNYQSATMYEAAKVDEALLAALQMELDIAGPLVDSAEKKHLTELLGKENVDDTTCYKIRLTTNEGIIITYWIDTSEYMLVKSTSIDWMNLENNDERSLSSTVHNPDKTTVFYKDYKPVDGILFAHSIHTIKEGRQRRWEQTIIFERIETNITVDKKMYNPEQIS